MSWSKRIVVAFDGSPAAQRALNRAAALARPGDAVGVVHVRPDAEPSPALERARRFFAERMIETEVIAVTGDPASEIADAAQRFGADMIVIGQHPGRLPTGVSSVSADLLRIAPCDVLAVHTG